MAPRVSVPDKEVPPPVIQDFHLSTPRLDKGELSERPRACPEYGRRDVSCRHYRSAREIEDA